MKSADGAVMRRAPKQRRAQQTVDAVLEAARLVATRHGARALTTNRVAEVAGVSVGSLYQYFPDKRAIFAALHDRHVDDVRRVIEQTTAACASAPLEDFARELVDGLMRAHGEVAELHDAASSAVPESALGFMNALHHAFERALSRADAERYTLDEAQRMLFVLPRIVESLVHGAGPASLSREVARSEAVRAVSLYVKARPSADAHRY
ncbi:MAG: TetR/AcrR family transcriptional regulator [Polyangiales bacterium]